jgi:aldehyde:ferredoxin oxidoreductase
MCLGFKGWTGNILRIDLAERTSKTESLKPAVYKDFVGGKGLGTYLLSETLKGGIDPLGPDNVLFFMTGPLQGLPGPSVGRWSMVTKSPLTGLYLDTHCGGPLGREIKKAGYDAVAVRGVSESPVTIVLDDDDVHFKDAKDLWGLGTQEATRRLHSDVTKGSSVYVIGPAGERKVPVATACCEYAHQTGRGGAGAVLGSKKLKGFVARGSKPVEAHDLDELKRLNAELIRVWNSKSDYWFGKYGTPHLVELANSRGQYPTRNWQSGYFEDHDKLDADLVQKNYGAGNHLSCPHCVMRCTHAFKTEDPSNPGAIIESTVEYETWGMMGGNLGLSDPESVMKLNYLCDDLGLDTISTGSIIGFAMECYEKGLLTEDAIGFPLPFGDIDGALKMVRMIASREGIGELLGSGVKKASENIGEGSEDFAVHVKGLETAAWDPRGRRGLGMTYATGDVGASHLRGWPQLVEFPGEPAVGVMESFSDHRNTKILTDSLIVCHFTYHIPLEHETKIELLNAATGAGYTVEEIDDFAFRVESLSRMFNIREGVTRADDKLPRRFWEPEPSGPAKGKAAFTDQKDFETALEKYYELRGWDNKGTPTDETLKRLRLKRL